MTLLEAIVHYCTNAGLVLGDGIDTFRDFMPEAPDTVVVFTEYSGGPASLYLGAVHRSVQVKTRSRSSAAAREKAVALFMLLSQRTENLSIDFTPEIWGQVYIRQAPYKLEQDSSGRTVYCFNLGITTTTIE